MATKFTRAQLREMLVEFYSRVNPERLAEGNGSCSAVARHQGSCNGGD